MLEWIMGRMLLLGIAYGLAGTMTEISDGVLKAPEKVYIYALQ